MRSAAPSLNRISVVAGVRDTTFVGSAGTVTLVPSSSVSVSGNDGTGVPVTTGAVDAVASGGIVVRAAGLQPRAPRATSASATTADLGPNEKPLDSPDE